MNNTTLFEVAMDNFPLQFQPDCGSDVTLISENDFANFKYHTSSKIALLQNECSFTAANSTPIEFLGFFYTTLFSKSGRNCKAKIYVADLPESEPPLIGEKHLLELGLITYHPHGGSIRKIAQNETMPKISIELQLDSDRELFENLHKRFSSVFTGMGLLKDYEVNLELSSPIEFFYRPALVPVHLKDKATERLKEYISKGLFTWVPEGSPVHYSSSLLVIEEKEKVRLVGDYRYLNQHIAKTATTPAPTLETFLEKLQNSRYFIATDMNKGYWQLLLNQKSQELCTLSTHLGNVRPTRVPMGVKISGDIFDAQVAAVLAHCEHTCHNRDDILIGCATIPELFSEWEKVLTAYKNAGLTLDPKKTKVGMQEISWYGFLFNKLGAQPSPKKVAALRSAPRPVSQEGLKSFICTVSFNSRFIHRFSEYAQILRNLANTKGAFIWLPSHENAFQNLKDALCQNTLNNFFEKNRQTAIFCDAGKTQHTTDTPGALSSILAQFDLESESWLPIQFASRVLTDCETRYGQTELEALSIRFSCTRFTYYIEGAKNVHIYTDCQALVPMFNKVVKTTPPRILRMILAIQSIDYVVIYLAGKINIADFLSRNPPKPDPNSIEEKLDLKLSDDLERAVVKRVRQQHNPITMNTIRDSTIKSVDLQFLLNCLKDGSWKRFKKDHRIRPYLSMIHELSEIDSIIYRGSDIIVIPEDLTHKVTSILHELGHQGENNTMSLIKQYFYYPDLVKQVNAVVQSCTICQQTKLSKRKEPYGLRPTPIRPFSEISVDHKGPLDNGYYVLVILDILSRYPDVAFVKSTSFEATREPLLKYFAYFKTPLVLRSDNGPPWNSEAFAQFSKEQNFKHDLITPRSPIANAEVERLMATIGIAYERAKIISPALWREEILNAVKSKRCTPHPSLGKSPYEVIFGTKMNPGKIAIAPHINQQDKTRFETTAERLFSSKKERQEKFAEQKNVKPHDFRLGDVVWTILEKTKKKKIYEKDLYVITYIRGSQITAKSRFSGKIVVRHSTHFKAYIPPIVEKLDAANNSENNADNSDNFDNPDNPDEDSGPPDSDDDNDNDPNDPNDRTGLAGNGNDNKKVVRFNLEAPVARQTRSKGPAPDIPNVLSAAPEYSSKVQRELSEIHGEHSSTARRPQN